MANEIQPFNYGEVEPATAEKLKRHETAIRGMARHRRAHAERDYLRRVG